MGNQKPRQQCGRFVRWLPEFFYYGREGNPFFPSSMACKLLDLHPANLRNLHLHLTKNPFANRLPHLCGVIFIMLSHFPHGTIRSIFAKNSRFFVCTCDNSSLRADRLSCLSIPMLYHLLRLFALCGIALILKRLSPFLSLFCHFCPETTNS